ncbi:zinc ABC transporter substrate-binding protein [Roseibium sp.]|uniref:zinc ABC transporter substrate-binding protein n=1 Tax=Roseibium sp. TaxID=1936156 RepID=UPI003A9692E0
MSFFPLASANRIKRLGLAVATVLVPLTSPAEAAPSVVTTIKPVHSLVTAVMDGVGTPDILIDGAASPHNFSLKPSQAFQLQGADLVFWIGEGLETSLTKAMTSLPESARVVELMDAEGLELLRFRDHDDFGEHDHGEEHNEHEAHRDGAHDEHDKDEHDDDHSEAGHDGHDHHGTNDPHIWLDPDNAMAMTDAIADALSEVDPDNAERYAANAAAYKERLLTLSEEIKEQLIPVRQRPFVVFHDAYHYFEDHFAVPAAGTISLNPETPASAERIREIRDMVKDEGIVCVFSEPQFPPKLVKVVVEGTSVRSDVLDPLGTAHANGPDLYAQLLQEAANSITRCLTDTK